MGHAARARPMQLDADTVAELRALATSVRPEDANEQPSHITYASDEHLAISLGARQCVIDAPDGEVSAGRPYALVLRLHAAVRSLLAPTR